MDDEFRQANEELAQALKDQRDATSLLESADARVSAARRHCNRLFQEEMRKADKRLASQSR